MLIGLLLIAAETWMSPAGKEHNEWFRCAYSYADKAVSQNERAEVIVSAALRHCAREQANYELEWMRQSGWDLNTGQAIGDNEIASRRRELSSMVEERVISTRAGVLPVSKRPH